MISAAHDLPVSGQCSKLHKRGKRLHKNTRKETRKLTSFQVSSLRFGSKMTIGLILFRYFGLRVAKKYWRPSDPPHTITCSLRSATDSFVHFARDMCSRTW